MRQSLTNLLYPSLGWSTLYFTVSTHFLVRSSLQTAEHRQQTACDSGSSQLFVIMSTTVVEITAHPGLNTSKPHTTGRLEAGFYTEVTHRVDHQLLLQVTSLAEVPSGMAVGRQCYTDCPVHSHTRHKPGPTGTEQDGMGRMASLGSR